MNAKKEIVVVPEESNTIQELHKEWAIENGYRENEELNSKNSIVFKDGAER